jgi:hypothetical protein
MFKKLFNSILGNDDANKENSNDSSKVQQQDNNVNEDNEDNDDAYEDEDIENTVTYDPETLHGTHYTVEAFNAEVEKKVQAWVSDEDEAPSQRDIDNARFNFRRNVYMAWNNCDSDQMIKWENANSLEFTGYANSANAHKIDMSGPLFEPVHGVDLATYAAFAIKISSGVKDTDILKALNIETPVWQEINDTWSKRMAEDPTFSVTTAYGQYFSTPPVIPALENLKANVSAEGAANLEKLKNDRYFYEELCGARQAAYQYGMDGAQYILDNFGIALGDFQSVAMQHMTEGQKNWSSEEIIHYQNYQEEKQKEYAAKFAAEQGGNVADDVEF